MTEQEAEAKQLQAKIEKVQTNLKLLDNKLTCLKKTKTELSEEHR